MTDRRQDETPENEQLKASIASGRITPAEAETIKSFFDHKPAQRWPASNLQQRMQGSGG